jgi:Winged helix-turn helix
VRSSTILDIPLQEQEWMLAESRHAQPGSLLTMHVLLLCAAGRTPTEIATFLFCSRTSVYRMVNAYQAHWLDARFDQPRPQGGWLSPSGDDQPVTFGTLNYGRLTPTPPGCSLTTSLCKEGFFCCVFPWPTAAHPGQYSS